MWGSAPRWLRWYYRVMLFLIFTSLALMVVYRIWR